MEAEFQTGDMIVVVLALLGLAVLVILFVVIFRATFLDED